MSVKANLVTIPIKFLPGGPVIVRHLPKVIRSLGCDPPRYQFPLEDMQDEITNNLKIAQKIIESEYPSDFKLVIGWFLFRLNDFIETASEYVAAGVDPSEKELLRRYKTAIQKEAQRG
jgi:hypothetical protein